MEYALDAVWALVIAVTVGRDPVAEGRTGSGAVGRAGYLGLRGKNGSRVCLGFLGIPAPAHRDKAAMNGAQLLRTASGTWMSGPPADCAFTDLLHEQKSTGCAKLSHAYSSALGGPMIAVCI